ncbi:tail length tape measure protein [Listeria ivanovii subsp. londoniensis]|nr:tail length tape measure protein [Listeria ivanovii subsp. londoniensis]
MVPQVVIQVVAYFKSITPLCVILEALNVARSTYYRWKKQLISHQQVWAWKIQSIGELCIQHKFRYGYRKITALLKRAYQISKNTVQKIIKHFGWQCRVKKKRKLPRPGKLHLVAPNLLECDFKASRSLEKLVTDITYLPTKKYLSSIMDLYDGQIIAQTIGETQDVELVLDTLNQLPELTQPCTLHSNQGSVYTAFAFQNRVKEKGISMSMSRKGTPADNACIESFHSLLKAETFYLEPKTTSSKTIVTQTVLEYITYYNTIRIQQKLGYLSPHDFRQQTT